MAKAELKTRETDASVEEFLNSVENDERRSDGFRLLEIFKKITGEEPRMWGPSIIGFGKTMLKYASGRELEWPVTAYSPRKVSLTLYLTCSIEKHNSLLEKLGPHKASGCCLYIKRLADIDQKILEKLIKKDITV